MFTESRTVSNFNQEGLPAVHQKPLTVDVYMFFKPLTTIMRLTGFLLIFASDDEIVSSRNKYHKFFIVIRIIYLVLMWGWTGMVTLNVLYKSISSEAVFEGQGDGHQNMVTKLLEETPYMFITIRCSLILTIFIFRGKDVLRGIYLCEQLRLKLLLLGGRLSMAGHRRRAYIYVFSSIFGVILWEIHEWWCWFHPDILGVFAMWDMSPLPFSLIMYQYAALWWTFTSIPFICSQLILCFPVFFSYVLRKFVRFVNRELKMLGDISKKDPSVTEMEIGKRVTALREAHLGITDLLHKLDSVLADVLLVQFLFGILSLFGFIGLVVESKDKPDETTMEWTFYASSAFLWLVVFLFQYTFPLIHMAEEVIFTQKGIIFLKVDALVAWYKMSFSTFRW